MSRAARVVVGLATGVAVLAVVDRLLDPVPLAAATVWVGAVVVWLGIRRRGFLPVAGGAAGGLAVSVAIHVYWHLTGKSPGPEEGLLVHVTGEALVGSLAGGIAFTMSVLGVGRSRLPGGQTPPIRSAGP